MSKELRAPNLSSLLKQPSKAPVDLVSEYASKSNSNPTQSDKRKDNPHYACFTLNKLEFFCEYEPLCRHSTYYQRVKNSLTPVMSQMNTNLDAADIVPSALILVLHYLCKDDGQMLDPKTMTLYNARNTLAVASALRIGHLEKRLLTDVISQQLNRDNVLDFL